MRPKTPIKGPTTDPIHRRPGQQSGDPAIRVDNPSVIGVPAIRPVTPGRAPTDAAQNAQLPSTSRVTVSATSDSTGASSADKHQLRKFWTPARFEPPPPDTEGISTVRGRKYVKVPDGGNVQIGRDPATGLYRAKLASEKDPSGPVLRFEPESRLWHPAETPPPSASSLSAAQLQALRTGLDLSATDPDSDGLHRFDGKLYVVIENHTYQVLRDLKASTEQVDVMRIIRPREPTAKHTRNLYESSDGHSQPIVYDARHGWQAAPVANTTGPHRHSFSPGVFQLAEVDLKLSRLHQEIETAMSKSHDLRTAWVAVRGQEGERKALVERELHHRRELTAFKNASDFFGENKPAIVALFGAASYRDQFIKLLEGRLLVYEQIIESSFTLQSLEGLFVNVSREKLPTVASLLTRQLGYLKKHQQISEELVKKWHVSRDDSEEFLSPMIPRMVALWVYAKSVLLGSPEGVDNTPKTSLLATRFGDLTTAYGALNDTPDSYRAAFLNQLWEQCAAIRAGYERLALPTDSRHLISRDEITAELKDFENTLEHRLSRYQHEHAQASTHLTHEQPIDFDFIPPQVQGGPAPKPWRVFTTRTHGISRVKVGVPRRTAQGEDLIDVHYPHDPIQPLQTYERHDGEWRPLRSLQNKTLPTLIAEANQHLEQSQAHLNSALRDEQKKNNPDNIVEALGDKADALDDLAIRLKPFETTDTRAGPLIARLKHDSQRLRTQGEEIRIRIYKDKTFLSASRLIYLIDKGHIRAVKTESRLKRGKGKNHEFIDLYSLDDALTGDPLWHAHFHYAGKDTPDLNFNVRGAHLKTLEQSAMGITSQRREAQAGRQHVAIWRESIDGRTAQKIFDLAKAQATK
ncbi:hypothetical protein [Pseudomonas sp.]|uniref:hypothetical protein n=1 Tax=Pseudomonas sp. TaxID=306 RepID=UPI002E34ECA9|nr:hypothetical protein [Pseudomonas sp.]HEX4551390.1 hypothetical protein [Pseudomonas sp.]